MSKSFNSIIEKQGFSLLQFYRNNPCIAAYDLLGVDLAPVQRVLFEAMWFKSYVIIVATRGLGKTFLSGLMAVLSCLLHPGYRVGLIGPSFRQSKNIFSEVEKLYDQSTIFREATIKRPIKASDSCYVKFKTYKGPASFIEALPIGNDGAKIRGSRFYCLLIDEYAQVPVKIIDTVLAPMSITQLNPMKKVRELERRKKLIEAGLAKPEDFEDPTINKMIGTSSGYYKFNHMYKRMVEMWKQIEEGSTDHAVFQVPYTLIPEGFIDMANVEQARRNMSDAEFKMEYLALMVSDSEGFFKASILEKCFSIYDIEFKGTLDGQYILGVDPNQGGKAKCGAVIIKLGNINKIVRVLALDGKKTQDIAKSIVDLCNDYNIIRIFMDRGGGGKAVADLLEEGINNTPPIIARNSDANYVNGGRYILELIQFSPGWISDANFATLSLFEDKKLLFPRQPLDSLGSDKKEELIKKEFDNVDILRKQCLNIVVTQTSRGSLHFDTPKKGQNKDLYSALILAGYGIKALEVEENFDNESYIIHASGFVRNKNENVWNEVNSNNISTNNVVSTGALLNKSRRKYIKYKKRK